MLREHHQIGARIDVEVAVGVAQQFARLDDLGICLREVEIGHFMISGLALRAFATAGRHRSCIGHEVDKSE